MDFKDILSQLSQISEATEQTKTGRVHKAEPGGYGRKHDADEEGDDKKKVKKDEPKKGRGRPKKDAGEDGEKKTYDTKGLHDVFGGGKKPKTDIGKTSKNHSLKDCVQEVEQKYVAEAVPPGMKPLAIIDPKNQQAGAGVVTSKNPAVQKMLGGLDPKDVQIVMTTQQQAMKPGATQQPTATSGGATNQPAMSEEDYSAKKARAGKDIGKPGKQFAKIAKSAGEKYGSKERGEKVAGAVLAKLRAKESVEEQQLDELSPETISSYQKKAYPQAVTTGPKSGQRAAGVARSLGREKTNEGDIPSDQSDMGAGLGAGRSQSTFEAKKPDANKNGIPDYAEDGKGPNDLKKKKKVDESMDTRLKAAHHRGKAHALSKESYNCKYDDMEEARMYHEGYKEGLDECYGQVPIRGQVVGEEDMPATVPGMADAAMDEGNAFTAALARTPHGGKFSVGGKTFTDRTGYDAKVDEMSGMFESWDKELTNLLTEYDTIQEGLSVNISKGQQGSPDSVSVTANDQEAEQLLQLVKAAGLGLFGDEQPATSSPMSLQPADAGPEEGDIDVVGDHDGMMALIKKVTGGAGEPDTVAIGGHDHDYEDEEGHEEGEECDACGHADCQCDHEEDEREEVDEVESEDQMAYEVAEDNAPDSGAAETDAEDEEIAQDNAAASSSGGATNEEAEDVEDDVEDEETVEESEKLDEWANEAMQNGTDAAFEADIAFMTKVIAGGLNKEKATGQTTVPVIPGQKDRMGYSAVNESIGDWKKLAGLK